MASTTELETKHPVENPGIFQLEVLVRSPGERGRLWDWNFILQRFGINTNYRSC